MKLLLDYRNLSLSSNPGGTFYCTEPPTEVASFLNLAYSHSTYNSLRWLVIVEVLCAVQHEHDGLNPQLQCSAGPLSAYDPAVGRVELCVHSTVSTRDQPVGFRLQLTLHPTYS